MDVFFATSAKRFNSTLQPSMTANKRSCVLKHPCSVINPDIELDRTGTDESYNYAYIPDFGRYYFVRDYVYSGSKIIYSLECDVLASGKTTIGNSYQYITRSAYTSNGLIMDNLYPTTGDITNYFENTASPWRDFGNGGRYIVAVIGNGGVDHYSMTASGFSDFISKILADGFAEAVLTKFGLTAYSQYKMLVDPLQYISNIFWLPYDTEPATFTSVTTINVGGVNVLNLSGIKQISGTAISTVSHSHTLQDHPQAATRGKYLNASPYTKIQMVAPPFGTFELDGMQLSECTTIGDIIHIEWRTGYAELIVSGTQGTAGTTNELLRSSANLGVTIPISQVVKPGLNLLPTAANLLSAVANPNPMGVIGAGINAIGDAVKANISQARMIGSQGSTAQQYGQWGFMYQFYTVVDDDNTQRGRPICVYAQVKNYPGYMTISDPDIRTNLTADEDRQINQYAASGFYYE